MAQRGTRFAGVRNKIEAARKASGRSRSRDWDEITGVTKALDHLAHEVRQKQPSAPEIHVHTMPAIPPSTPVPTELRVAWKYRGWLLHLLPLVAGLGLGAACMRMLRVLGILR